MNQSDKFDIDGKVIDVCESEEDTATMGFLLSPERHR